MEQYLHLVHGPYQVAVLIPNIHLRILIGACDANSRIMTSIFPSWRIAIDVIGVAACSKGRRSVCVTIVK